MWIGVIRGQSSEISLSRGNFLEADLRLLDFVPPFRRRQSAVRPENDVESRLRFGQHL